MSVGLSHIQQNRLLSLLPQDEATRLAERLEPVSLEFKQILCEPGEPIRHIYFPQSGVVSWLAVLNGDASAEVATIGHEGMVGVRVFLGADTSPALVMVQVPGPALRLGIADFREYMRSDNSLVQILHRYLNAFLTQLAQSVACNTFHSVKQRFCRWLLMTHDRVRSDQFPLTHELAAQMLGVRRASVTDAARKLQSAGLIRYTHGKITVLDRQRLETTSCVCYRAVKADYDKLLSVADKKPAAPERIEKQVRLTKKK